MATTKWQQATTVHNVNLGVSKWNIDQVSFCKVSKQLRFISLLMDPSQTKAVKASTQILNKLPFHVFRALNQYNQFTEKTVGSNNLVLKKHILGFPGITSVQYSMFNERYIILSHRNGWFLWPKKIFWHVIYNKPQFISFLSLVGYEKGWIPFEASIFIHILAHKQYLKHVSIEVC